MHALFPKLLLTCACFVASASHAAIVMQVALDVHHEPSATVKNVPADQNSQLEVTLADRMLTVRNAGRSTIYDFVNRKRIETSDIDHTRVDYSLFDTVGFRVLEVQNRIGLDKMMAAAKVGHEPLDVVNLQHMFSVTDHPGTPLEARSNGVERSYVNGTTVLFRESVAATEVTAAQARMFAQFVRYIVGGHPQILAELAASNAIPERLVLQGHEITDVTMTLVVAGVRSVDDAPIDLSRYHTRPSASDADPLDRLLDRATALGAQDLEQARRKNIEKRATASRDGRAFDHFLALMEWNQMNGGPLTMTAEERTAFQNDPSSMKLATALAAKSKEQITAALPVMVELKASAPSQVYLLELFEANDRRLLGDGKAGRELLTSALIVNPFLAGAWKDLGDAVLMTFDTPRAWRCWDVGRSIAPKFQTFEAIDRVEQSLAAGHPEYF